MNYAVMLDVAHDCPFDVITQMMSDHKCVAMKVIDPNGPGGGNPFVEFQFETADDADNFTKEFHNS